MKILIIDNYDSFTYNLYQYVGEILLNRNINFEIIVKRNNEITVEEIKKQKFDRIIISPGPGSPDQKKYFGICKEVITTLGQNIPILGVCLGMQGIAHFFGSKVIKAQKPMHGKTSIIKHKNIDVFKDLPQNLEVMRYHSLIVNPEKLSKDLEITAFVKNKVNSNNEKALENVEIMGLKHRNFPISGVQFHPESFATEGGKKILDNFLNNQISS